jgi:hypothetical protein
LLAFFGLLTDGLTVDLGTRNTFAASFLNFSTASGPSGIRVSYSSQCMPENTNPSNDSDKPIPESWLRLIEAKVDEHIKEAKKAEEIPRKKRWKHSWRSASPITKGTFILTSGIAGATIAYSIVAIFQLYAMNKQAGEMKATTTATREAAYTACLSAQIARSTLAEIQSGSGDTHNLSISSVTQAITSGRAESAQLRFNLMGYFHADGTTDKAGTGKIVGQYFNLSNVGRTAALNVHFKIQIQILDKGKEPNFSYPMAFSGDTGQLDSAQVAERRTIWVRDSSRKPQFFTDSELADVVKAIDKITFTYGRVTYLDMFGVSHWIQVCRVMEPPIDTITQTSIPKCAAYNKADTNQIIPTPSLESPKPLELPREIPCKNPD